MCYCDDADPQITGGSVERKARKPHKCYECRRAIAKGETYTEHSGLWRDGGWMTFRWCEHCAAAQEVHQAITKCHCYTFGGLWEGIRDSLPGFGDVRDVAVCRLIAGMDREWRRRRGPRKGELMPLPVVPVAEPVAAEVN